MPALSLSWWKTFIALLSSAILLRWSVAPSFGAETHIDTTHYLLLFLSILFISTGGNIINSYFNLTSDHINHPNKVWIGKIISVPQALYLYFTMNLIGILLIFYLFLFITFDKIGFVFYALIFLSYAPIPENFPDKNHFHHSPTVVSIRLPYK